jgi:hypothetical protein
MSDAKGSSSELRRSVWARRELANTGGDSGWFDWAGAEGQSGRGTKGWRISGCAGGATLQLGARSSCKVTAKLLPSFSARHGGSAGHPIRGGSRSVSSVASIPMGRGCADREGGPTIQVVGETGVTTGRSLRSDRHDNDATRTQQDVPEVSIANHQRKSGVLSDVCCDHHDFEAGCP